MDALKTLVRKFTRRGYDIPSDPDYGWGNPRTPNRWANYHDKAQGYTWRLYLRFTTVMAVRRPASSAGYADEAASVTEAYFVHPRTKKTIRRVTATWVFSDERPHCGWCGIINPTYIGFECSVCGGA